MTDNEKIMVAGCAAGAAAAVIPSVYGYIKAVSRRPISDEDFLQTQGGGFITQSGERIELRGVNLNDDLLFFKDDLLEPTAESYDVFSALDSRFGRYGAMEAVRKFKENFIAPSDLKYLSKLGANCVRIPLRWNYMFKKESCNGDIDFDRLDLIIEKCRRLGLYVILDLHSAPGFQNNCSSGGADSESQLFSSTKAGFEARNATIRLWTQVAAHYKDEPAVAAYDLLNRPLSHFAEWEDKLDCLNKFYRRIYRAIRTVDERHIAILQAISHTDTFPTPDKIYSNIAYGIYSHFHTTYETDSLINCVRSLKDRGIPFIVCKIRAKESLEYSLRALSDNGVSWLAGDFKGSAERTPCLFYSDDVPPADLKNDSYDVITEKWSKPVITKNFTENKEVAKALSQAFKYGAVSILRADSAKKAKPSFKVKFGSNRVIGINKAPANPVV